MLWFSLPNLRRRFGDARALALARAAEAAVDGIGDFCESEAVDAWFRRGGYLQASTAPGWDGAWSEAVAACRDLGAADAVGELSADQVRDRCASPLFRGGAFYPSAATVQPARLARGLRGRLIGRGVEIFEGTGVRSARERDGAVAIEADGGLIRAGSAILAAGGRLAGFPGLRRRLTLTSSHMVLTEPVPDVLEALGWTGGECITDSRAMVHYLRTTPDGRIAFGWGGGDVVFGARTGGRAEVDPGLIAQVERHLLRFFPMLAGRRIVHAWGGPIDVSPSHVPIAGSIGAWNTLKLARFVPPTSCP
jgi:glycine/D-amino acid oxidase-like deaminating enzyme